VGEKVIRLNSFFLILFIICFIAACAGSFFLGIAYSKSGNTEHSRRDHEYSRQMGRASELLESVDERLGNIYDGLSRVKVYLGQDAGDLRGLAQRLRIIAEEVADMENDLFRARDDINYFFSYNDSFLKSDGGN